jgi:hypothetical protein
MKAQVLPLLCGAALLAVGCSDEQQSRSSQFESLLILVEEGEVVLEAGISDWTAVLTDFVDCISLGLLSLCEEERLQLEKALDSTIEEWDFQDLKAELQALRLTENVDASRARDAYVKHLRAWRDEASTLRSNLPSASQFAAGDLSFLEQWREVLENNEAIVDSFDATCSGLGNGQPDDSTEFNSRIIDVCDD